MKITKNIFKILLLSICLVAFVNCNNEPVAAVSATDTDGDSINDQVDNCPAVANQDQLDTDGDGVGNICDTDDDGDGVLDADDNCPLNANPNQEDIDTNGIGDVCDDDDDDDDGIPDVDDNCPMIANTDQLDTDADGIGDVCDDDDDNDGILDVNDNCSLTANTDQEDADSNGVGDVCEPPLGALFPCENGMAGIYPCNGYDLMSHIPISTLATTAGNPEGSDIWGWTDPTTGNEYALVGTTNSTAFVDITDPINPIFLGRLETSDGNDFWRDIKVYNNYAFIVADGGNNQNHGMQVFDLTRLRNVPNPPETFVPDTIYTGVGDCHNIVINKSEAVAYLVDCDIASGGPVFVDISNPLDPVSMGDYPDRGETHDAQVVTYSGPDSDYTGKEILIGSNTGTDNVVILDVTDKSNVILISEFTYPQARITHQGWFTDNQRYFLLGDEGDEIGFGFNTRILVFDFNDLDNPVLSSTYIGPTSAIDHNGYVKGNEYFLSNYTAGLRVLDITNIAASSDSMTEIGYFDTHPENNIVDFAGAWSVYPYFASGNIVISDIERGLFVVRRSE